MPPCHHWSWSSTKLASDHLMTVSRRVFVPGTTVPGDVELRGEMGVLADAHVRAVEGHDEDALRGADMEHDALALPALGQLEGALVDARRVHVRDMWWQVRVGHLDVGVLRLVVRALHRPDPRDRDVPPDGHRARRRAATGTGTARSRPGPAGRRGARCASGCGRCPSVGDRSRLLVMASSVGSSATARRPPGRRLWCAPGGRPVPTGGRASAAMIRPRFRAPTATRSSHDPGGSA